MTARPPAEIAPALSVEIGGRRYGFASLAAASAAFCAARDRAGLGASEMPPPPIVRDAGGAVLGYIAYNGRVFPGRPGDWRPGVAALFDPYRADAEESAAR